MMGAKGDCAVPVPAASKALKKTQEDTWGNSYKPVSSWQKPITSFFEPVSNLKHLRFEKGKENERPKKILHTLEVKVKKQCQNSLKEQETTVVFPYLSQEGAGGNHEKSKRINDKISLCSPLYLLRFFRTCCLRLRGRLWNERSCAGLQCLGQQYKDVLSLSERI